MGFHIAPMLLPDIPRCFDIYIASFANDVMGSIMLDVLYPGGITDEVRAGHAQATLEWLTHSTSQYNFKCVDTDSGEIVGMVMADWYVHGRSEEERKFAGIPWLEGEHRERAEKILKPLWKAREKYIGGQPHIYCHVIGVDPTHQGRKAGATICQFGKDFAEGAGVPLYFEASPSTWKLYEKMGYELLDEPIVHKAEVLGTTNDISVPLMVLMPKKAGMSFKEWHRAGFPDYRK
ncbi:hypothetical protein TD95_001659 [Thielaviopsis punctulata]|uniref:N-acetyltransferase domain-containing protein n=1 Tax=Thielaviopsis punctulata TaxID=72032 RepID=A0A0F4ZH71_9PEZI|nr:hypothetical protein TD95_001659 [Thielaviopsis punctulata]